MIINVLEVLRVYLGYVGNLKEKVLWRWHDDVKVCFYTVSVP